MNNAAGAILLSLLFAMCGVRSGQASSLRTVHDCDSADPWHGGSLQSIEGGTCIRWLPAEAPELRISDIPHDWSGCSALRFRMCVKNNGGKRVRLTVESPSSPSPDFSSVLLFETPSEWRTVIVPLEELRRYDRPADWESVSAIGFRLEGEAAAGDIQVLIDDLALVEGEERGPRLTDEEFFAALDLSRKGLEKVEAAVSRGDMASARHEFAEYIRARSSPVWLTDWKNKPRPEKPNEGNLERADKVAAHEFNPGIGTWGDTDFGPKIDWRSNDTENDPSGEKRTIEWNASLNRHRFLPWLGLAYWETGDEKYAREYVALVTHWIEKCPVLQHTSGNRPYHYAWETLNTAVRANSTWWNPFFQCLPSSAFTDDAVTMVVKSFYEHVQHLKRWPSSGNWLTAESYAMFCVGTMFPEFKDAPHWRSIALDRLHKQLTQEVCPDGLQCELAFGYNLWVLSQFARVLDLAELNGGMSEIPEDFLAQMEKMYNYVLYASTPKRSVPGLNDSNTTDIRGTLRDGLKFFPQRDDFLYVAGDGKEGRAPDRTSYEFPYSGHYVMRSDWEPDARYLLLDAGPFGAGHQHEDKLTLVIYAYGKQHITDAGNYMYDASRWRRYVLSTRGHNTVRVDGEDQNRRSKLEHRRLRAPFRKQGTVWVSAAEYDYTAGRYGDGYGKANTPVTHTRKILFVKPDYWIVADVMAAADSREHEYESLFHLDAEDASVTASPPAVITENADASNFAILPVGHGAVRLSVVRGRGEPRDEVQGWAGQPWRAVPTCVVATTGSGTTVMAYVLYPIERGRRLAVASAEPLDVEGDALGQEGAIAGRIRFVDGRVDYFVFKDGSGEVTFDEFETDGTAAAVRLGSDGRIKSSWQTGGTYVRRRSG